MTVHYDKNIPAKVFKRDYERAVDWFVPLRKKEENGQQLTKFEKLKYEWVLHKFLLPLTEILREIGEEKYLALPENKFTYNLFIK